MSPQVLIVDLSGLVLAFLGFSMAFRQSLVRHLLGWTAASAKSDAADPAAYGLRIAGIMVMIFGFTLGMMVTLFSLA